jgi:hypothetical protein
MFKLNSKDGLGKICGKTAYGNKHSITVKQRVEAEVTKNVDYLKELICT